MNRLRVVPPTRKTIIKQSELSDIAGFEFDHGLTIPIYFYKSKRRALCYYKTIPYANKFLKREAFRKAKFISYLIITLHNTKWTNLSYTIRLDLLTSYSILWNKTIITNASEFKDREKELFDDFDFLKLLRHATDNNLRVERPMIYDAESVPMRDDLIKITRYRIELR